MLTAMSAMEGARVANFYPNGYDIMTVFFRGLCIDPLRFVRQGNFKSFPGRQALHDFYLGQCPQHFSSHATEQIRFTTQTLPSDLRPFQSSRNKL